MKNLKVKVETVKIINAGAETSRYGSAWVKNSMIFKKLLINGVDTLTGEKVYFFSPAAKIRTASGLLNYESLASKNGWFKEIKGEIKGYKGHKMFDGGKTPNIAIADSTKIVPAINVGDVIEIKGNHTWTSPKNGAKKFNRVKLV